MNSQNNIILVKNISKFFGDKCAVNCVSFDVKKGEILVILGPNGAGKTTIIRILSTILTPSSGYVNIYNYNTIKNPQEIRKIIGVLGEAPGLYQRMNIYEYLLYFGRLYNISDKEIIKKANFLIDLLGLKNEVKYPIETLSKGTKQKISLIRTIIHSPKVIFLDEPTSAMDPYSAKIVRDYILTLKEEGCSIIVCTHNLLEAEYLSSKLAIIKEGKIKFNGKIDEFKKILSSSNLYFISYANNNEINFDEIEKKFNIKIKSNSTNNFIYEVREPENTNPQIIRYLISKNINIIDCCFLSRTLEDAYLQFIEKNE